MTLWYRAPEVLLGTTYATPVDIWSIGCIFAELFTRKPLFPGQYEVDQLAKIFEMLGTPSESEWPEDSAVLRNNFVYSRPRSVVDLVPEIDPLAKDLIEVIGCFFIFILTYLIQSFQRMLRFDPKKRITAHEALEHPYFSEYGCSPHDTSTSSSSAASSSIRMSDRSSRLSDMSDSSLNLSHNTSGSSETSSSTLDKSL